jgi:hypothetical protein
MLFSLEKKLRQAMRGLLTGDENDFAHVQKLVEAVLYSFNENGSFWNYDFVVEKNYCLVEIQLASGERIYIELDVKVDKQCNTLE